MLNIVYACIRINRLFTNCSPATDYSIAPIFLSLSTMFQKTYFTVQKLCRYCYHRQAHEKEKKRLT